MNEANAVLFALPEANDAAGADAHARRPHRCKRLQPVLKQRWKPGCASALEGEPACTDMQPPR